MVDYQPARELNVPGKNFTRKIVAKARAVDTAPATVSSNFQRGFYVPKPGVQNARGFIRKKLVAKWTLRHSTPSRHSR
jgi:hypothetical protein